MRCQGFIRGSSGALAVLSLIACGDSVQPGVAPNHPTGSSINQEPALRDIGVLQTDAIRELRLAERSTFERVRTVTRVCGGRLAVADQVTSHISLFDQSGRLVRTIGRTGAGPGEFQQLQGAWPLGDDSIIAWDGILNRGTIFGCGDGLRVINLSNTALSLGIATLSDTTFVVGVPPPFRMVPLDAMQVDSIRLFYVHVGAGTTTPGPMLPSSVQFGQLWKGGRTSMPPPLSPAGIFASIHNGLLYGWSATYELFTVDPAAGRIPFLARTDRGRTVTTEMRSAWESELMTRAPSASLEEWQRYADDAMFPALSPAFDQVAADDRGRVWVREYAKPGDPLAIWSVFDGDARWSFDVRAPAGHRLMLIADTIAWAVWEDRYGGEHVAAFPVDLPSR